MPSRLRPTPETGRVAATRQPASAIGPSWSQRGSREARLAFRQAQRRGDREGAMRVALEADKSGLASQASIGSAEERLAGQYQGRGADTAITAEIETALTPPAIRADGRPRITMDMRRGDPGFQEQPTVTVADRFRSSQEAIGGATVRTMEQPAATRPPIPEPPVAPGASQPPENPVSGSATPVMGDAQARLGIRKPGRINGVPADKAIGDAQARVDAIPGRDKTSTSGAAGSDDDFGARVRELTSVEGGDMFRGAAVKQANAERVAAGKTPLRYDDVINAMREQDRQTSAQTSKERILAGRFAELDALLDPATMLNKARGTPPSAAAPVAATPAPQPRFAPIRLPLTRPPIQGPANPLASPAFRTSMTTPEARLARLKEEGRRNAAAARDRKIQASREIDARIEEQKRNIEIPEWQKGTILGRLTRRLREASIESQR